jgi:hypothetical protein
LSVPLSATDADGDGLALSGLGLPAFCTLIDNGNGTGRVDCSPLVGDDGVYPVTIRATDDGGPNLTDSESFEITVDLTTCVDLDGDGYGFPGDLSCRHGAPQDCNDSAATVNPAAVEACRSAVDADCDGLNGPTEPGCPSPVCVLFTLGAPGSDPTIRMANPAACPAPVALPRAVDLIWGDFAALVNEGSQLNLGAVSQVVCAGLGHSALFDNLKPASRQLDFFLARESGQPAYGIGVGLPRVPGSGGCP